MSLYAATLGQVLGKRSSGQIGTVNGYAGTAPFGQMTSSSQYNAGSGVQQLASAVGKSANYMANGAASGNAMANQSDNTHDVIIDTALPLNMLAAMNRGHGEKLVVNMKIPARTAKGSVCFSLNMGDGKRVITTLPAIRAAVSVASQVEEEAIGVDLKQMPRAAVSDIDLWQPIALEQYDSMEKLVLPLPFVKGCPGAGLLSAPVIAGEIKLKINKPGFERVATHGGGQAQKTSDEWVAGSGAVTSTLRSTILAVWTGRPGSMVDLNKPIMPSSIKKVVSTPVAFVAIPAPGVFGVAGVASSVNKAYYGASYRTAVAYMHPGYKKIIAGVAIEDAAITVVGRVLGTASTSSSTVNAQTYAEKELLPLKDRLEGKDVLGSARCIDVAINPQCT